LGYLASISALRQVVIY